MPFIYYQRMLDPDQLIRDRSASIATRFSSKVRSQQKKREILSEALYFFLGNGVIEELATNPGNKVVFKVRGQKIEVAASTGLFNTKGATLEQLIKFVCLTHQITPPDFLDTVALTPKMNNHLRERARTGNKQKRKTATKLSLAEYMQQAYAEQAEQDRLRRMLNGEQPATATVIKKLILSEPASPPAPGSREYKLVRDLALAKEQAKVASRKESLAFLPSFITRRSSSLSKTSVPSSDSTGISSPGSPTRKGWVGSTKHEETSDNSRRGSKASKDSNPSRPASPST